VDSFVNLPAKAGGKIIQIYFKAEEGLATGTREFNFVPVYLALELAIILFI